MTRKNLTIVKLTGFNPTLGREEKLAYWVREGSDYALLHVNYTPARIIPVEQAREQIRKFTDSGYRAESKTYS